VGRGRRAETCSTRLRVEEKKSRRRRQKGEEGYRGENNERNSRIHHSKKQSHSLEKSGGGGENGPVKRGLHKTVHHKKRNACNGPHAEKQFQT